MNKIVIKAGGSGNIIESNYLHPIEWMNYRKFQIKSQTFSDIVEALLQLSKSDKVVYVNGGVAAFLFINLAKSMQLGDEYLSEIGCSVINITAFIVLRKLLDLRANVYPKLLSPDLITDNLFNTYDIVIVQSSTDYQSSDELATYTASKLSDVKLVFFKKGIPIFHTGFEKPTEIHSFPIDELLDKANEYEEVPGRNYILDKNSLRIIKDNNISTTLFNSDDICTIKEKGKLDYNELPSTKIIL